MKYTLLFFFNAVLLFSCKGPDDSTHPVRRDLTQAVYASGRIYPVNNYKVFSKLPGYIEKVHVQVGDSVKIGQPLITIKSELSELNVEAARNLLSQAEKNANERSALLSLMKQDAVSSKARYELDSTTYYRYMALMKDNAISKQQLDQSRTQFDISKQNYLKSLSALTNARDKVRVELENARIQYEAQVSSRNDYTITSAVAGKIYDIIPKEGELINIQAALMEIGDSGKFEVELSVDETDVSLIRREQPIVFVIDAYKSRTFMGKVVEAYPRISLSNKTAKVIASISLTDSVIIYSGMSVEANIIVAEKKNVLVIPREFLVEGSKVKKKGSEELSPVRMGVEDLEYVEIIAGLEEDTEIIRP